jgi:uncharacterized membrane protein
MKSASRPHSKKPGEYQTSEHTMLGLTPLGIIHTAISLVAVAAGIFAFIRHREIALRTTSGQLYVATTVLTCLTGFGIFQHGGFGAPHVLGIVTLLVLAAAAAAEKRVQPGNLFRYVAVVGYSLTFFFHMIPAFTETATRLPVGAPLATGPDDPGLKAAIGCAFVMLLVGLALQVWRLRSGTPVPATAS